MSAPTQALPSWLTLSTTVVTQPDGSVFTSSTTLQLPLTYFGPSIPLGTDGTWTYGGLSPPPSVTSTPSPAPPPSSITLSSSPSPTGSSLVSSVPSSLSPSSSSSTSSGALSLSGSVSSSASTTAVPIVSGHHGGLSKGQIGGIIGGVIGFAIIAVFLLIYYLLRRRYKRHNSDPNSHSSSFWNRQTTLFTRPDSRQTPIWTGWEIVNPDDMAENGGERSPGAGSPRGSGDETDPFLTRHSVHDSANEMIQTKKSGTETLVSLPATAALGSTSSHRSGTRVGGGPILTREALLRMNEEDSPFYDLRVVPPSSPPRDPNSPLLPPPPLNPDGKVLAARTSQTTSDRSLASQQSKSTAPVRSIGSEKSVGSFATNGPAESVELLTARRVRVGELGQTGTSTQPQTGDLEAGTSASPSSVLGLDRLANLGRLSWFRRMSFTGSSPSSGTRPSSRMDSDAADAYTRPPPRSTSRLGSHSRPGSWARVSRHEAAGFGPDGSANRRARAGAEMGLLDADRPISTLSATSATSVSGNTIYHDAQSRPATPMGETPVTEIPPPVPTIPSARQQELSQVDEESSTSRMTTGDRFTNAPRDPPSYEETTFSPSVDSHHALSELDVLDMPIPRPASPFSAVSPRLAGSASMLALPNPAAWRDSHASSHSSAGIHIDVLEDSPPSARSGWREIATGSGDEVVDGRRTTFGAPPTVVHRDILNSEEGSLHSMRSHLSPHSPLNASGSAPASSRHTLAGSNSSRPSERSYGHTPSSGVSLGHSSSISSDDRRRRRRGEPGEVGSPPISAVFNRGYPESTPPPPFGAHGTSPLPPIFPSPPGYSTSLPTPEGARTGTVTSSATRDSGLSNTTTSITDPISGATMHLPRLPWHTNEERSSWHEQYMDEAMW